MEMTAMSIAIDLVTVKKLLRHLNLVIGGRWPQIDGNG
jgi:hypothetical protein